MAPGPACLRRARRRWKRPDAPPRCRGRPAPSRGPGLPGSTAPASFFVSARCGRAARVITVVELSRRPSPPYAGCGSEGELVEVETAGGTERHLAVAEGWEVAAGGATVRLAGLRRALRCAEPLFDHGPAGRGPGRAPARRGEAGARRIVGWVRGGRGARARLRGPVPTERRAIPRAGRVLRGRVGQLGRGRALPGGGGGEAGGHRPSRRRASAPPRQRPRRHPRRRRAALPPPGRGRPVYGFLVALASDGRPRAGAARRRHRRRPGDGEGPGSPPRRATRIDPRAHPAGLGAARRRRGRVRSPGEPDAAGPGAARGAAGLERWWRLGLPARRPAGLPPRSATWSSRDGRVAGFTSTGSKRPRGALRRRRPATPRAGCPARAGCRVWDDQGGNTSTTSWLWVRWRSATAHPAVRGRGARGVDAGVVGPLAPVLEEELAAELCRLIPWIEQVRFLKTGAEAMAAAVRLARVTGRDAGVLGCGYHGWLDWCQTGARRECRRPTRALYARAALQRRRARQELIRRRGRPAGRRGVRAGHSRAARPRMARGAAGGDRTGRRGSDRGRDQDRLPARDRRRVRALRHPARSGGDGQGDRQRLPAGGGGRARRGDGRRAADLDLLHPGHRVGLPGRRSRHARGDGLGEGPRPPRAGRRAAAGGIATAGGAAPGVVARAWPGSEMCHLEYRTRPLAGGRRGTRPGAASSSSAAPTTSSPWRTTTRGRGPHAGVLLDEVLQALAP